MVSIEPGSRLAIKRPGIVQGIRVVTGPTGPAGAPGADGTGNVNGPASSVNNRIAVFSGTTGKLIADSGSTIASITPGSASTTAQGIVELATSAETQTGTDTARAVTPAGFRAGGDARYAQNTGGGREKTFTFSATTGTTTGDLSQGSLSMPLTPTGNITLAFSNVPASGTGCFVTAIIEQGATVRTVTPPTGTKWVGSPAPTQVANKTCVFNFLTVNGGTTWYASAAVEQ